MSKTKLVRDRIPEIVEREGGQLDVRIASSLEYWTLLKEKLIEEVGEFNASEEQEELADILEVIATICQHKGIDIERLMMLKEQKANRKGSFSGKYVATFADD